MKSRHHSLLSFVICSCTLIFLTSCSPVIEDEVTQEERVWQLFRQIEIESLADADGQYLEQQLEVSFNALGKNAPHNFNLQIDFNIANISLTRRNSYRANAVIRLYDSENKELLFTSQARGSSRYTSLGSNYQQEQNRDVAKKRSLNQLAKQIHLQLHRYFLIRIKNDGI